ncbi:hypothetical protein N7U49_21390 [Streptomyces sp. AD2-2]|nr:hypothetical protein N7U49_21390 [Streptomyces sp. AD2-2]
MLTTWHEGCKALIPYRTPEEEARDLEESRLRIAEGFREYLDANNTAACSLCLHQRLRTGSGEPYYYPASECENAGLHGHYHRDRTKPAAEGDPTPTADTCSCGSSDVRDVPPGETPDGARYRCGACGTEW